MLNFYNVLIDSVGVVLLAAILISERRQRRPGDPVITRLLHWLMLCCTLVFLTDIPGLLLDGKTFPGARVLLWFLDGAYWVFQAVYCWLWLLFADRWAFGDRTRPNRLGLLYTLPMAVEVAVILSTPWTGWVFTLDAGNVYARDSLYLPNILPYAVYILAALILTLLGSRRDADPAQRRRKLFLAVYMFLPVCGVCFDAFVYGISWVWPMVALSLLMVYLTVEQQAISEERLATAKLEAELTENRIAIMLSQIQPHFLYNALNTVDALCDVDTKAAQKAVRSFAKYLRGNLDALTRKMPVPFREELSHLQQYLTLETYRFDNLRIEYDLETVDFMLPPLSLQPIVENAVKYGISQREDGGTITIATRDKQDYIQLTVRDDGAGFDMTKPLADGRSHIGIRNVRSRLESMCGGTLTVDSRPDAGTIVTYILPKGGTSL